MADRDGSEWDVIIVGAGAAGLMCGATAGLYGKRVLIVEHTKKIGEKIRISGGGRCNFTNLNSTPAHFLSSNPHFCKSALSRYTPHDFLALVERHNIAWTEKATGQLFAQESAQLIIQMLLEECAAVGVQIDTETSVASFSHSNGHFTLELETSGRRRIATAPALVVASGGKSIPKIGATGWGYSVADHFGLRLLPTRAGLVPLTFSGDILAEMKALSGVAVPDSTAQASSAVTGSATFRDALLFTHRGLSGPSILQVSSYWDEGTPVTLNLMPGHRVLEALKLARQDHPKQMLGTALKHHLPDRLVEAIMTELGGDKRLADCGNAHLNTVADRLSAWSVIPSGTEGYRTAEVTLGGVDTQDVSSKTMAAKKVPGLYFIGEVVDVTGHLGGHNFQWAWASGHAAGTAIGESY